MTITGRSGNDVVIHAVRRATRDRLERIKLDIEASGSLLTIQANRKSSDSWFDFRGNTVVETDFDTSVRLVDGAAGNLSFNSFSGDLRSDVPLTLRQKSRRRVSAKLNDGGSNELHFKTFSGDVRITR